ncbi:unnamed protein product [Pleuronectes platessa]|uniref:Uncharacterized protein n=1 Tax=Pleuronectes platessa TaxID=8262 RepID=A0A9N7W3M1_PLEPL|nr:unnamed protein product [Pleuronectes platessa]
MSGWSPEKRERGEEATLMGVGADDERWRDGAAPPPWLSGVQPCTPVILVSTREKTAKEALCGCERLMKSTRESVGAAYLTAVQPKPPPLHLFRGPPPELQRLSLFK